MLVAAEAVWAGRHGDGAAAAAGVERSLELLAPNRYVRPVLAWQVGPVASAQGWGQPAEWLTDALAAFEQRGLSTLAADCRARLRRTGRLIPRADDELTAREREILTLVAEGLGNRSIAERLFLSPRTVEKHVQRLLAKTGAGNRAQLVLGAVRDTGA